MSKLILKIKKVAMKHPRTKEPGFAARVLTNGTESFQDICELAGLNTTLSPVEIEAASKLMLQAAARALKNGKIIDLGVLGKIYPSANGKWVEKEEDLTLDDLTLKTNYRASDEISSAIKGASIAWATKKDEESQEPEPETNESNTQTGDDNGGNGGNPGSGELEG